MDSNHQEILDNLDEKAPRSRLAPYRDLILELRRQNRTYREIHQILADRCQICVSISTLHDFLHAQRRIDSKIKGQKTAGKNPLGLSKQPLSGAKNNRETPDIEVQQRIAALKQRVTLAPQCTSRFIFDPSQPLHLPPNMKKCEREK